LESAGEEVELLALVNPSVPIQFSLLRGVSAGVSRVGRIAGETQTDLYLRTRHALRHVYRQVRPGSVRVQDFGELLAVDPRLDRMFPCRDALYSDYVGVLSWSAAAYKTGIFGGAITFIWAREEPVIRRAWEPVINSKRPSHIEEHVISGTHMSCATDDLPELAEALAACLTRVERQAPAPSRRRARGRQGAGATTGAPRDRADVESGVGGTP